MKLIFEYRCRDKCFAPDPWPNCRSRCWLQSSSEATLMGDSDGRTFHTCPNYYVILFHTGPNLVVADVSNKLSAGSWAWALLSTPIIVALVSVPGSTKAGKTSRPVFRAAGPSQPMPAKSHLVPPHAPNERHRCRTPMLKDGGREAR